MHENPKLIKNKNRKKLKLRVYSIHTTLWDRNVVVEHLTETGGEDCSGN